MKLWSIWIEHDDDFDKDESILVWADTVEDAEVKWYEETFGPDPEDIADMMECRTAKNAYAVSLAMPAQPMVAVPDGVAVEATNAAVNHG